ncbi:MAG: S41 family peptidase [Muribaculaceae bacterium]
MRRLIYGVVCAVLLPMGAALAATGSSKSDISRNLVIFNALVKELMINYVDTIDVDKLMTTTIGDMLSQIDPYTTYYPADDTDELAQISTGQYGGIGAYLGVRDNKPYFSVPMYDSPARAAGIRHGDMIIAINGDSIKPGTSTEDVSRRLRGQPGTKLTVTVRRPYVSDSILTFELMRKSIKVNALPYYGVMDDGAGYISLTTFNEKSAGLVRDAIVDMQASGRLRSIILDLRSNGGGIIDGAVQIVGLFVPKGTEVVRTRGANPKDVKIYKTTRAPIVDSSMPVAVLIDGATASAAEIVAGALQDLDRAVIIGSRSYGKGLVQASRQLPYDGLLKVTIARYYIPSGRLIQALDYSHRNADGSPGHVPDSLTSVYYTRNKRPVRDGGGIMPDVVMPTDSVVNALLYNIVTDNWAYDYANRFRARHPMVADADHFEITDSIFEDFKRFIDPARFKYDKLCDNGLKYLRDAARFEGYMNDTVAAQFDILAAMLKHDLNRDLDFNREAIKEALDEEISGRYFSEADYAKRMVRHSADIDTARAVLADYNRYRRLLIP